MKLDNIKNALANLLFEMEKVEFGKMTTDKGVIGYEGELEVGVKVFAVGENDEQLPIEDGDYTTDEGTVITIKEGVVEVIVEKEVEPEAEPEAEPEVEPVKEETPIVEEQLEEEKPVEEEKPIEEEPEKEDNKLEEKINDLTARIEVLEGIINELKGKSTDKPVEEEFEAIKKKEQTPLKGKERANNLIRLAKK